MNGCQKWQPMIGWVRLQLTANTYLRRWNHFWTSLELTKSWERSKPSWRKSRSSTTLRSLSAKNLKRNSPNWWRRKMTSSPHCSGLVTRDKLEESYWCVPVLAGKSLSELEIELAFNKFVVEAKMYCIEDNNINFLYPGVSRFLVQSPCLPILTSISLFLPKSSNFSHNSKIEGEYLKNCCFWVVMKTVIYTSKIGCLKPKTVQIKC